MTAEKIFQFELVSPEKVLFSQPALQVVIPGSEGDFGVLFDHAPLLSSLRPGVVSVTKEDGSVQEIFVAGGFADVNSNICTVLAEEAVNVNELDKDNLEKEISNLNDEITITEDEDKKLELFHALTLAKAKLQAVIGELVL